MKKIPLPKPKLHWDRLGNGEYQTEHGDYRAVLFWAPGKVAFAKVAPASGIGSSFAQELYVGLTRCKCHVEDMLFELAEGTDPLACIRHKMNEPFQPATPRVAS